MDSTAGPSQPRRSSSLDTPPRKRSSSDESDRDVSPPHYDESHRPGEAGEALLGNGKVYTGNDFPPEGSRRTSEDVIQSKSELASIEQRKALWWRNVIVTGMFIASW